MEVKQPIQYTSNIEFLKKDLTLPESLEHDIYTNRKPGWLCNFIINNHTFVHF